MQTFPFNYIWVLYAVSALLLPVVIIRKNKPVTAVAWCLAIIFLPILGAILFLTFGTERIVNKGRKKMLANETLQNRRRATEAERATDSEDNKAGLPDVLQRIVQVSRRLSSFDAVGNNHVEILVDARETYQRMEETIAAAERHINLEYYIFRPDATGARFRDLLIAKAREGIQVNFLYDAMGSIALGWSRDFLNPMRDAGIRVREFLPLRTFFKPWNMNLRNHRKLLIVDGKVGFTGSLNIGEDFLSTSHPKGKKWRETHIKIHGPAVTQLQWIFCEDWYFATEEELVAADYFPQVEAMGEEIVQIVASGPDAREEAIHKVFVTAISQARQTVYLTSPYFIPDEPFSVALQLAALRGVDVKVLVPFKSDHGFVNLAGRSYYDELLQRGIEIYEYRRGYLHAKMLIVDGWFTVIGSANVDVRSFSYNFEVNVQVYGASFARKAQEVFDLDLTNSTRLDPEVFRKRAAYVRFGENTCRLFSPVL